MNQAEPEDGGHAADSARHAASFEEIVAEWIAEGTVPSWPEGPAPPQPSPAAGAALPPASPPAPEPEESVGDHAGKRAGEHGGDQAGDQADDHYVPPDPPPMPRIGVTAAIGLALLGLGVVFLSAPSVLGHNADLGLPLGLVSLALGLGWLVLRSWPASAEDGGGGGDDGAVL